METLNSQVRKTGASIRDVDRTLKGGIKDLERKLISRTQVPVGQPESNAEAEAPVASPAEAEDVAGEENEEEAVANAEEAEGQPVEEEQGEQPTNAEPPKPSAPKPKTAHKDLKDYTTERFAEIELLINERIDEIDERLYKMNRQQAADVEQQLVKLRRIDDLMAEKNQEVGGLRQTTDKLEQLLRDQSD